MDNEGDARQAVGDWVKVGSIEGNVAENWFGDLDGGEIVGDIWDKDKLIPLLLYSKGEEHVVGGAFVCVGGCFVGVVSRDCDVVLFILRRVYTININISL